MQIPPPSDISILSRKDIYQNKHIKIKKLSRQLGQEAILEDSLLRALIKQCKRIVTLGNEPNVISVNDPVTIVGDIHGQLYDLLKILSLVDLLDKSSIGEHKVIFLGDYVDRGLESLQVVTLLMALKIQHPQNIYLLRGNHESRTMTEQYNFKIQCLDVYNQQIYDLFMQLFDSFPLACVVNKSYFCVHGGISDKQSTIAKINSIQRICEIPIGNVLFCDLIWSDPIDNKTGYLRNRSLYNFSRDCSIVFGAALANDFLRENKLQCIVRAHEVFFEGYNLHSWNPNTKIPPVITIFSAPNYCGTYFNKGAILKIEKNQMNIKQIKEHEPQKHQFLNFDVFSWTMGEVMSNVHQIMVQLTRGFANKHAPQLKEESILTKGLFFVKFVLESKKIRPHKFPKFRQTQISKVPLTEDEERQILFNRSQDYYGESEKVNREKR